MVTTSQKPAKDTQRLKGKEPKQNTKENCQRTREDSKSRKEERGTAKTAKKNQNGLKT